MTVGPCKSMHSSGLGPWLMLLTLSLIAAQVGCTSSSLSSARLDSAVVVGTGGEALGGGGGNVGAGGIGAGGGGIFGGGGGISGGGGGAPQGGSGGDPWTDPNCYMRCGQGNAIYYGGGGHGGWMSDGGVIVAGGRGGWMSDGAYLPPGGGGGWMSDGAYISPSGGGGSRGDGGRSGGPAGWGLDAGTEECSDALPIKCADQLSHSTSVQGRPNLWELYPTTERVVSGPETVYVFQAPGHCGVKVRLVTPASGLALFALTACGARWAVPLNGGQLLVEAGQTYYLVVDGYEGAAGSYTLQVDCTCV